MITPFSILIATVLASTMPPAEHVPRAASYLRSEDYRVARIAYRLGLMGARYCTDSYPLTGLLLHHLAEYSDSDRSSASALFGLGRGPGVLAVMDDSPAAHAGLQAGDVIVGLNGRAFPSPLKIAGTGDGRQTRIAIETSERMLEDGLRMGRVRLTVLRDGREFDRDLGAIWGCPARARLARSGQMNAFANRGYAIVTTRLLSFIQNDDELAIVVGHELAHVMLGHPDATGTDRAPRSLLRHFGKAAALSRAREAEADRLGLKLAWAAGYDVNAAIPFWRRFHASKGPGLATTHPGLKTREKLVEATIAELGPAPAMADRP